MFTLEIFRTDEAPLRFAQAIAIRRQVFVDEQQAPSESEPDPFDNPSCTHWLLLAADGTPAATGRLFPDPHDPTLAHLGRLAVQRDYRRRGLASQILRSMLAKLAATAYRQVVLESQTYVTKLYRQFGFHCEGDSYVLDGIPHLLMRKLLGNPPPDL